MGSLAKRVIVGIVVLVLLGAGAAVWLVLHKAPAPPPAAAPQTSLPRSERVGTSVEGRAITAHTYGNGATRLLFVGGMHGGYEWNSVLLAYQLMDYLQVHPEIIPAAVSVTVIPSINPDAVYKVVGKEGRFVAADATTSVSVLASARFNANGVDLNRNFDCKWQATSTWQSKAVSGGTSAFSEPEAAALRDWIYAHHPAAAVFWHSASNAVYASQCGAGILPQTREVMSTYATAAGYAAVDVFDAYPTTGAADDWLASVGIPAVTVELSTHNSTDWDKNLAGIRALLNRYGK